MASARPEVPLPHLPDSASPPNSASVPERDSSTHQFVLLLLVGPQDSRDSGRHHHGSSPCFPIAAAAFAEASPFSAACSLSLGL